MFQSVKSTILSFFLLFLSINLFAGISPCAATKYQLSDFGITKTYTLDNGTYTQLADPSCGDYQGQDFWVEFTAPTSGMINIELLDGSITDAAFEVYSNACNGLAAPVGCFADRSCGNIPMPGANLDVIPGQLYHVRIFQEGGGGGTLGFRMSDLGGSQFNLGGDAIPFDSGVPNQTCFQLTAESPNQLGCAWFDTPIDFASGFEINYQLFFGDKDDTGADGIAFVFHTETNPSCNSQAGGSLGFLNFSNTFIVEFDTYNNGNGGTNADIPDDHVAIVLNGVIALPIAPAVPIGTNGNVEDGLFHDVTLAWDPITNLFEVYFDGELKISVDINLITSIFGSGQVFWGLTGTTGGSNNNQIFCFDGFTVENSNSVETNIDAQICDGQAYVFGNDVLFDAGTYTQPFPAANGCDSTVTLVLEIVDIDLTGIEEVSLPCGNDDLVVQLAVNVDANVDISELSFSWDSQDGSFDSGQNTLTPIVSATGTYVLTVEHDELGCEVPFTVEVSTAEPPFVSATGGFLGCGGDSTLVLDCNFEGDVDIEWTTTDGNIVGATNVQNPVVDTLGTYTVVVTDRITGCTNTASTSVGGSGGVVENSANSINFCLGEQGPIFLDAELSGDIISFEWTPGDGLSDPTILNPEVLDLTQAQIFTLEIKTRSGLNFVQNGSFAQGDTLFTSDYELGSATAGEYQVTNDPRDFFSGFSDCDDNSEFDDLMMVIDGDGAANQNVWCQEVEVAPDNQYIFSTWFTNLCTTCSGNFPMLSLTINGDQVNMPSILDGIDCEWEQIQSECWNSTGTTAELCITNLETATIGNDFALDDIEFYLICDGGAGAECGVFPYEDIDIDITPAEIVCQPDGIITLEASILGDTPTDVSWSWELAGNNGAILSDMESANPSIQGPGIYLVTLIDNITGCSATESIIVEMTEPDFPDFSLSASLINCDNPTSSINIGGLDANDFSFDWGSENTPAADGSIEVSSPGIYTLVVTDLSNNCTSEQSIGVNEDLDIPNVDITPVAPLTCLDNGVSFDIVAFVNGNPFIDITWSTVGGTIVSGSNEAIVQVSGPGIYTVEIIDFNNGCVDDATITIIEDTTPPVASLSAPEELNCSSGQTNISVNSPAGSDYSYSWTNGAADFTSDSDQVTIDNAGNYQVVVTDNISGCTTLRDVTVEQNIAPPTFTPNTPIPLNCNNDQTEILISGNDLSFDWTSNPNIISALSGNSVTVVDQGQYEVLITNTITGCDIVTNITVDADFAEPDVEAGMPQTFGCTDMSINLTGATNSDITAIEWTSAGGVILSDGNTLTPSVAGAGIYYISVTGTNGCIKQDSVEVLADVDLPIIAQLADITLDCNNPSLVLEATSSSTGAGFAFEWKDTNGNIITAFNTLDPTVSEPGEYFLTITNTDNGCTSETSVNVLSDMLEPEGQTTAVPSLSCTVTSATFGMETSNVDFEYTWSSDTGVLTGETQFQLETTTSGEYTLLILDRNNGCSNEYIFTVEEPQGGPDLTIEGQADLSCTQPELTINAISDAQSPTYAWELIGGSIVLDSNASLELTAPGTYSVTVTDGISGCVAVDEIVIAQDASLPNIDIPAPDQITCDITEVTLLADVSNIGTDVDFIWSTMGGILNSPNGALGITVGAPGTYTLTVVNNENGCDNSFDVIVEESISNFVVEIEMPSTLDCNVSEITLSATQVIGAFIEYSWITMDGNIVSGADGPNPVINQAGTYTFTITDLDNNCSSSADVTVLQNGDLPQIAIADPANLDCNTSTITLEASGSSEGLAFLTTWTTADGNIVSGEDGLNPIVDQGGSYILTIRNVTNNCETSQEVIVVADKLTPEVEILPVNNINCDESSIVISTQIISTNTNLEYEWSTISGSIIGDISQANIEVNAVGTYVLLVTDPANGCSDIFDILVEGDEDVPDVSVENPSALDCINASSLITLNLPSGAQNLTFNWESLDGQFSGDATSPEIEAMTEGEYSVTVTNTLSNCSIILSAFVPNNAATPTLAFIEPDTINCVNVNSVINTQTNQNGLLYEWSSQNGLITSDIDGEDLVVGSAGLYTLVVTDPTNNCENIITVEIFEDIELPTVVIQPALALNCLIEEQSLSGDGSSVGTDFSYAWTSQSGNIVSGESTLNPLIGAPGLYTLEVTNNENSCVQLDSIIVTEDAIQPLADITMPGILDCTNGSIIVSSDIPDNSGLDLTWTTIDGNIISDPSLSSIEVDMPGIYELAILNNINGCNNLLFTTVTSNTMPPVLEVAPGFEITCNSSVGVLSITTVDADAQLSWLNPQGEIISSTSTVEVDQAGSYTLIATSSLNGCETTRTVEVTENQDMPTDINAGISSPMCLGDLGSIAIQSVNGGQGPYLYSIDGGQTFGDLEIFDNLEAGSIIEILVLDSNGCELAVSFTIPIADPVSVNLPPDVDLILGEDFQLQVQTSIPLAEIDQIIWTPTLGLSCTDCLDPIASPSFDINYQVEIISLDGCSDLANIQFRVDQNINVFIPNAFSPFNEDGFNDRFYIFTRPNVIAQIQSLQIYDRWGNQVFINEDFLPNEESEGWNGMFRNEEMQTGVYVYYAVIEFLDGSTELFKGDFTLIE